MTMLSLDARRYTPVALRLDVAYTPSISYLIRQRSAQARPDRETLFALADPVFPKIHRPHRARHIRGAFSRAVKVMGLFLPLPETRDEVLGIQGLFPPGRSMILTGEEATEARSRPRHWPTTTISTSPPTACWATRYPACTNRRSSWPRARARTAT